MDGATVTVVARVPPSRFCACGISSVEVSTQASKHAFMQTQAGCKATDEECAAHDQHRNQQLNALLAEVIRLVCSNCFLHHAVERDQQQKCERATQHQIHPGVGIKLTQRIAG